MSSDPVMAVVNPVERSSQAAARGAWAASRLGERLALVATVHQALLARDLFHISEDLQRQRDDQVSETADWLGELARGMDAGEPETDAVWAHPFDEGVRMALERHQPQLVMLSLVNPSRPSRAEWRLIKQCPVPLWIVKKPRWSEHPRVLACVDPTHARDKPAGLDREILGWADRLAAAEGASMEVLHATGMTPELAGSEPYTHQFRERQDRERGEAIRAMLGGNPSEDGPKMHFIHSDPVAAIRAFVSERDPDLLVMGSMSRSWLSDRLIGSTSRELVPELDCDLLLIPLHEPRR